MLLVCMCELVMVWVVKVVKETFCGTGSQCYVMGWCSGMCSIVV